MSEGRAILFNENSIYFPPLYTKVSEWDNETLELSKISRLDMGAYLCIAANGVPPTVSKRIKVSVDCEYKYLCFETVYIVLSMRMYVLDIRLFVFELATYLHRNCIQVEYFSLF